MNAPCQFCGALPVKNYSRHGLPRDHHHPVCRDMQLVAAVDVKVKEIRCFRHVALLLDIIANKKRS